jgi:hypothetical protein
MNRTWTFAGMTATLCAVMGVCALTAEAHTVAHAAGCVRGKEAAGCKINGTGYDDFKTRVIVGFPFSTGPKGTPTELSVPASFLCAGGGEAIISVASKAVPRIGGSMSFSGKAKIQDISAGGATNVKSATITAKLKITNAKQASLSGGAELTLGDGSKCSKKLPSKLLRVLGG